MTKVGRPPKISEEDMPELVQKFADYIDDNDIPILAEFAYKNDLTRPWLYDQEEFSTLIKKCIDKKEVALERGTLTGTLNAPMAIFSLKQLGWSDKQEHAITADVTTKHIDLKAMDAKELEALEIILQRHTQSG